MKPSARLSILVAALSLAFLAIGAVAIRPAAPKTVVLSPNPVIPTQLQSYDHKYLAMEWQGNVAIFVPEDLTHPHYITEISMSSLTSEDAKRFREGIKIYTDEELAQLIEDFDS